MKDTSVHTLYDFSSRIKLCNVLIANGYWPINCNGKTPSTRGWNKTMQPINQLSSSFYNRYNIGIVTRNSYSLDNEVACIDIDAYDEKIASNILEFLASKFGKDTFLIRYGNRPKFAAIFRTKEVIAKGEGANIQQVTFHKQDEAHIIYDNPAQFVAFGIHPDTNKPYTWVNNRHPANTPVKDLPLLTLTAWKQILVEVTNIVTEVGYSVDDVYEPTVSNDMSESRVDDDILVTETRKHDYSDTPIEEVERVLETLDTMGIIKPSSNYDKWRDVSFVLAEYAVQSGKVNEVRDLFHKYSAKDKTKYNVRKCQQQWMAALNRTSDANRKKITLATFYGLLKQDTYYTLIGKLGKCHTLDQFDALMTDAARCQMGSTNRDNICLMIRKAMMERGLTVSVSHIRRQILPSPDKDLFYGWVFVADEGRFYHRSKARYGMSKDSANIFFFHAGRNIVEYGVKSGLIPTYSTKVVRPYHKPMIDDNTINLWDEDSATEDIPDLKLSAIIEKFLRVVYGEDADYLMDLGTALAHNRDKRLGICIVLLSELKGTGKSLTASIFSSIVGRHNSQPCNDMAIVSSAFSKFAPGASLIIFNDPSFKEFDEFNKLMKTHITEDVVYMEKKYKDANKEDNFRTFIITSNEVDKYHYDVEDRRYALFIPVVDKSDIDLYRDLYRSVADILSDEEKDNNIYSFFLRRKPTRKIIVGEGQAEYTKSAALLDNTPQSVFAKWVRDMVRDGVLNEYDISEYDLAILAKRRRINLPLPKHMDDDMRRLGFKRVAIVEEYGINTRHYVNDEAVFS